MRRSYEKPNVKKIKLVVDEAVLNFCKAYGSFGPDATGCAQSPGGHCLAIYAQSDADCLVCHPLGS